MTIRFRLTPRTAEERARIAAAFEAYREAKRAEGNQVELARLRNRFLDALGPDPLEALRRDVAPAFAELLESLQGTAREVAAIGADAALEWPEAEDLRRALDAWAGRWRLIEADAADRWIRRAALRTVAWWHRTPGAPLRWTHMVPAYWLLAAPAVSRLANLLAREGREPAERWIRDQGYSRAKARELLELLQDRTAVLPRRRRRNARLDDADLDASELRSLEWLAARCCGVTDAETARAENMTRQAVSASNRRTANLLALAFEPRRGRPAH